MTQSNTGVPFSADIDEYLKLCSCDPTELAANQFLYSTQLVNKSGTRQALLPSRLAAQLNSIRSLRKQWHINIRPGAMLPDIFWKVLNEEPDLRIRGNSNALLTSPVCGRQLGTASIMFAISLLASAVVFSLVTGQLDMGGPVTTVGVSLGAVLVTVPLIIAIHLALGRVRVRIENSRLRLELRHGVLGTNIIEIPLSEIKGVWLVRTGESGIYELLMLREGSFLSIPVTEAAWPNWQAVFVS